NGILPMLATESRPVTEVVKLSRHADFEKYNTFNALNYYVDAAAKLAAGAELSDVGKPYPLDALERMLLPGRESTENMLVGSVLHIDAHGNLITDIREEELLEVCAEPKKMTVRVGECLESLPEINLRKNFLGVMPGTVFAVTNMAGYIELVQQNGSLAALLYGQEDMLSGIGDTVTLHFG
ncbi:MAG: SAM-dependent chlorinase/fluorinase, partial [Bacteroidales bacterium]|nr:SAM-dependent chlorinase/fluorinase [Bacteroidales bacterium]